MTQYIALVALLLLLSPARLLADAWNVGGGAGAPDPLDEDTIWFRDDFLSGTPEVAPDIGDLGWDKRGAGALTSTALTITYPNLGIARMDTGATLNNDVGILLLDTHGEPLADLAQRASWEMKILFKLEATTTVKMTLGACEQWDDGICASDGVFLRYNTATSDTNFMAQACAASVCSTAVSTGVLADTAFHKLRIFSTAVGTIQFQVDAAAPVSVTTNLPTVQLTPLLYVQTLAAASKFLQIDYFAFKATVAR